MSAEQTLNIIQALYERKYTTYPRVDTQYLSDDIYPKCPQIMNGLFQVKHAGTAPYAELVRPLGGKPLIKPKRIFDTSKVTDHHAIIPTGVPVQNLTDMERRVYDLVARRFIAAFWPDCKFATTTVLGEVGDSDISLTSQPSPPTSKIEFKATGKLILDPGWRTVFGYVPPGSSNSSSVSNGPAAAPDETEEKKEDEEKTLPDFVVGESGPHEPTLTEKWTTPPPYYNEASLLRAMETAGKFVEDEELRAAMKENGIGRPSSRASIIETLFKRHYIRRERKRLVATSTGIELIDLIKEELLKSCELTGIWEKKLRDIEHQKYDAQQFIQELKEQITQIVSEVLADNSNRRVTLMQTQESKTEQKKSSAPKKQSTKKPKKSASPKADATNAERSQVAQSNSPVGQPCPLCGKGHIIKGHTAYGCSEWKNGCTFRQDF
jgi:DNA topoisomerase-3